MFPKFTYKPPPAEVPAASDSKLLLLAERVVVAIERGAEAIQVLAEAVNAYVDESFKDKGRD